MRNIALIATFDFIVTLIANKKTLRYERTKSKS